MWRGCDVCGIGYDMCVGEGVTCVWERCDVCGEGVMCVWERR